VILLGTAKALLMKPKGYLLFLIIPFIMLLFFISSEEEATVSYVSNPDLKTVINDPSWKGTPLDEDGKFRNLHVPFESSFWDLLKWQLSKNPQKAEKEEDKRRLPVDFDPSVFQGEGDFLIWLGHASFLMRINGITLLTDPVLLDNLFLKRKSKLPFPIEQLPKLDYVLISHGHRDHCDKKTIELLATLHPKTTFLVGLKMKELLSKWVPGHEIQEAGWFQEYDLGNPSLEITYLPSRHWSRRGLFDQNEILWGGFYFKTPQKSVYFMGDSGYGPHFRDIKKVMGTPDYCIMGVGAFKPEWFMSQSHISPTDAIKAFNEMEGDYFIPMHFGTFDLSDEPLMEPLDILLANEHSIQGTLINPVLGQNFFSGTE
jgi:L-ascorbate metabolism protein UlaG (beta-lactamase superfamily)